MLQFARHWTGSEPEADGADAKGRSLTIGEIARIEGLSPQYAGKLIRILRMGKLLESVRGRHGGYKLAKPLEEISVGEVIAILGGRVFEPDYCSRYPGDLKLCVHTVDCAIRSLWGTLQSTVDGILSRIKLRDLMGTEKRVSEWLGSVVEEVRGDLDGEKALAGRRSGGGPDLEAGRDPAHRPALVEIEDLAASSPRRKEC